MKLTILMIVSAQRRGSVSLTYLANIPGPLIVEVLGDDALANLGAGQTTPALAVRRQLVADFSDGMFDTFVDGVATATPIFNNNDAGFTARFNMALASSATQFGGTALSIADFSNVVGSLAPEVRTGDADGFTDGVAGGGSGATQMCLNAETPVTETLPVLIASQIINFDVSFLTTDVLPRFALADTLEFTFSGGGFLFQDNVLVVSLSFYCGGTEIFWQNRPPIEYFLSYSYPILSLMKLALTLLPVAFSLKRP